MTPTAVIRYLLLKTRRKLSEISPPQHLWWGSWRWIFSMTLSRTKRYSELPHSENLHQPCRRQRQSRNCFKDAVQYRQSQALHRVSVGMHLHGWSAVQRQCISDGFAVCINDGDLDLRVPANLTLYLPVATSSQGSDGRWHAWSKAGLAHSISSGRSSVSASICSSSIPRFAWCLMTYWLKRWTDI